MSLDVYLTQMKPVAVFSQNITHNLTAMAEAAGIYQHLWRPEEIGITKAQELIAPLKEAVGKMKADPERFRKLNSLNGWGTYDNFVPWIERYIAACEEYPDANVVACR